MNVSILGAILTTCPETTFLGISIGEVHVTGQFGGFYNALDADQQLYKKTGLVILPGLSGFPEIYNFK